MLRAFYTLSVSTPDYHAFHPVISPKPDNHRTETRTLRAGFIFGPALYGLGYLGYRVYLVVAFRESKPCKPKPQPKSVDTPARLSAFASRVSQRAYPLRQLVVRFRV